MLSFRMERCATRELCTSVCRSAVGWRAQWFRKREPEHQRGASGSAAGVDRSSKRRGKRSRRFSRVRIPASVKAACWRPVSGRSESGTSALPRWFDKGIVVPGDLTFLFPEEGTFFFRVGNFDPLAFEGKFRSPDPLFFLDSGKQHIPAFRFLSHEI